MTKLKLLFVALLLSTAAWSQSFYSDRAVGVDPFSKNLNALAYAQVRVCQGTATPSAMPCTPVASVTDISGNALTVPGGAFGQVRADSLGRFNFGCSPSNYLVQIATQASNTPTNQYLISCPQGTPLRLQVNGALNGSQTSLNLIAGNNISLSDNGVGGITITSAGGGGGGGSGNVNTAPTTDQIISQPTGTTFAVNDFQKVKSAHEHQWTFSPSGSLTGPGAGTAITAAVQDNNSGVITLTFAAHAFNVNDWIIVSGVTPSGYNGTYKVLTKNATTVTYQGNNTQLAAGTAFGTAVTNPQVVTINAVRGISADSVNRTRHMVYLAGTGTPEATPINATTCTNQSTGSCTVTISPSFSHPAGFTIGTATAGFQESLVDAYYTNTTNPVTGIKIVASPYSAQNTDFTFYGTFYVDQRAGSQGQIEIDCQQATLTDFVPNAPMIHISSYGDVNDTSGVLLHNCGFVPAVGVGRAANGNQTFILDEGQSAKILDNNFLFINSSDVVDYLVKIGNDQSVVYSRNLANTRNGPPMKCDSTWCGSGLYVNNSGNGGLITVSDNDFTMQCNGNAIDIQSGNGAVIEGKNVIQNFNQWGIRYWRRGGFQPLVENGGIYFENGGTCNNPDFGQVGRYADIVYRGGGTYYTGGQQLGSDSVVGGAIPLWTNTGTVKRYAFYAVYTIAGKKSVPLYIGNAYTNNVTGFSVSHLSYATATSCDLIASDVTAGGSVTAPFGAGSWLVSGAYACNAGTSTTVSITLPITLGAYTVDSTNWISPDLPYWTAPLFMTTNGECTSPSSACTPLHVGAYRGLQVSTATVYGSTPYYYTEILTTLSQNVVSPGFSPIPSRPFYLFSQNGGTGNGGVAGILIPPVDDQGSAVGLKGRINFPSYSFSGNNSLMLQLYDAAPFSTWANGVKRPTWGVGDMGIGFDTAPNRLAVMYPLSFRGYLNPSPSPGMDGTSYNFSFDSNGLTVPLGIGTGSGPFTLSGATDTGVACVASLSGANTIKVCADNVLGLNVSVNGGSFGGYIPLTQKDVAGGVVALNGSQLFNPLECPVFGASGASHARGCVPDPGAIAGSTKFLREDGTWQTPAGGGAGYTTVDSAGVALTQRSTLNFGAKFTAADNAGASRTDVTDFQAYQTIDSNGAALTQRLILNFGSKFTCADNAGATRTDCTDFQAYQTVQAATVSQTQRLKLNFGSKFTVADNAGNGSTDVTDFTDYQIVQAATVAQTQRRILNFGAKFTLSDNGANASTDITDFQSYQTVQVAGSAVTQREIINFIAPLFAADNGGSTRTDISLNDSKIDWQKNPGTLTLNGTEQTVFTSTFPSGVAAGEGFSVFACWQKNAGANNLTIKFYINTSNYTSTSATGNTAVCRTFLVMNDPGVQNSQQIIETGNTPAGGTLAPASNTMAENLASAPTVKITATGTNLDVLVRTGWFIEKRGVW